MNPRRGACGVYRRVRTASGRWAVRTGRWAVGTRAVGCPNADCGRRLNGERVVGRPLEDTHTHTHTHRVAAAGCARTHRVAAAGCASEIACRRARPGREGARTTPCATRCGFTQGAAARRANVRAATLARATRGARRARGRGANAHREEALHARSVVPPRREQPLLVDPPPHLRHLGPLLLAEAALAPPRVLQLSGERLVAQPHDGRAGSRAGGCECRRRRWRCDVGRGRSGGSGGSGSRARSTNSGKLAGVGGVSERFGGNGLVRARELSIVVRPVLVHAGVTERSLALDSAAEARGVAITGVAESHAASSAPGSGAVEPAAAAGAFAARGGAAAGGGAFSAALAGAGTGAPSAFSTPAGASTSGFFELQQPMELVAAAACDDAAPKSSMSNHSFETGTWYLTYGGKNRGNVSYEQHGTSLGAPSRALRTC
eukprot:2146144-Prymnesium_polylepis.3